MAATRGVEIKAKVPSGLEQVLTEPALDLVSALHREFDATRLKLLAQRTERQARLDAGERPGFLEEARTIRESDWKVASIPADLRDRRVEITGPVERKMIINALNSGAKVFMADFEDSNSPTWENVVRGQQNLIDAIERTISIETPEKRYRLNEEVATLLVRPRGWHLPERHVLVDGEPVSGALFDFGLYMFHNAKRLLEKGSGPYFYLPKLESHLEARLWNDVFKFTQDAVGVPQGSVRATVLIETILAAFEMEEILYELREHSAGLNAGRWDYIFSLIKKFRNRSDMVLPDRAQITMTVPFMRAYTELLVRTCHRREAFAMGGMAAFIPSRKDAKVNEIALTKVREDKVREAGDGFDGTWVAHPDLVPVAMEVFDGTVTEAGLRNNVSVALQYLASWLDGNGAVAIFNLMEDAATAEISRSQVWQWQRNGIRLVEGPPVTADLVREIEDEELEKIRESMGDAFSRFRWDEARRLFESVALADEFDEFLTLPAYRKID